ncbi:beta-lactamase/transpeptidase-like protein [Zopfia rhizophila CBS 207.26]|uniref:Beta-lactamase/transpeptidase-like protein n=1 Tax=Zopfia rhizophila CBS 207.26 TaxID=1314779 RepID=A0A6A6D7J5_9PEZI|nr:beta-lactamase/transpeptidase-like protein [Zopfia rhizophila CBS 207.26]
MYSGSEHVLEREARCIVARLEHSISTVPTILDITRTPSVAIGVLHGGKVILTKGIGMCDQQSGRVPDQDTIFSIGSCTKAFTATVLHILQRKHKWKEGEPVSSYVPELNTKYNTDVSKMAEVPDLLSHASGLANLCFSGSGRYGEVLPKYEDVVRVCSNLPKVSEFRASYKYNNWFYALASYIIFYKTGKLWAQVVKEEILDPIGMGRTFASANELDDNYARSYTMLDSRSIHPNHLPCLDAGMPFEGSGSLRSCVRDLLKWAVFIICAARSDGVQNQKVGNEEEEAARHHIMERISLLASLREIQRPHNPLSPSSVQAYGHGLYVLQLPAVDLNKLTNSGVTTSFPYEFGESLTPRTLLGHTGELQNFTSAYWIFPSTASAVVVLSNGSGAYGDASNVIAQVLMQALFDIKPAIDYEYVAMNIYSNSKKVWDDTFQAWKAHRTGDTTPCKDLNAYTGRYVCPEICMTLDVTIPEEKDVSERAAQQLLKMQINGMTSQVFILYHYHNHVWTFMPHTIDDALLSGYRNYIENWATFIIDFTQKVGRVFMEVSWQLGINEPVDPQRFRRLGFEAL